MSLHVKESKRYYDGKVFMDMEGNDAENKYDIEEGEIIDNDCEGGDYPSTSRA